MSLRLLGLIAVSGVLVAGVLRAQTPASSELGGVAAAALAIGTGTQSGAAVGAAEAAPAAPLRDPFWPVGYVPRRPEKPAAVVAARGNTSSAVPALVPAPPPAPVVNPVDWDEARRHLEIRGISRIARDKTSGRAAYFAVVGGRMVEEGDAVNVTWNGHVYRWRVTQIGPAGLQLVKMDTRSE